MVELGALCPLVLLVLLGSVHSAFSVTRYVDASGTNATPPYTNWADAALTIQDAVDAALPGDKVIVTNGIYQSGGRAVYGLLTNRLVLNKPVAVGSVNGPGVSVISGNGLNGDNAVRCVYMTNGASLSGFTLLNGGTRSGGDIFKEDCGAGVWCESTNALVSDCLLVSNSAALYGGGSFSGTLTNCSLLYNTAIAGGGGASNVLNDCLIVSNVAVTVGADTSGGGAQGSALARCSVSGNASRNGYWGTSAFGGGVSDCTLINCSVTSNSAQGDGGGAWSCTLENCSIVGNISGNLGGGAWASTAVGCLIVSNTAGFAAGGFGGSATNCTIAVNAGSLSGGGVFTANLFNCVVYYNTSPEGDFNDSGGAFPSYPPSTLSYCCTSRIPNHGTWNITNAPSFQNLESGSFQFGSNSACINSGNNAFVLNPFDLNGNPRIQGGTVDLGAFEYQRPSSLLSYAWAQQFGLATDGSADFSDADGDGMNNYQEWIAGTDPTNALSALTILTSAKTSGFLLTWQSVTSRVYLVQRANAARGGAFKTIATGITGQSPTTGYFDFSARDAGPWFYRVGVAGVRP